MPKNFFQITKIEKHTIKNKTDQKSEKNLHCFGCKDYTQSFRPEKVTMTNKVEKYLTVFFVDLLRRGFFLKKQSNKKQLYTLQTDKMIIKIR